jgi:hypothetical protein
VPELFGDEHQRNFGLRPLSAGPPLKNEERDSAFPASPATGVGRGVSAHRRDAASSRKGIRRISNASLHHERLEASGPSFLMGNQIPQVGMGNQCVEQGLGLGVLFRPEPD